MLVGRDKWTLTPQPRPGARLRLICFHHAGGGAFGYRPWARGVSDDIELVAVQLPGRENRLGEPPLLTAEAVLDRLVPALDDVLDRSYALFGHSLGAVLAYLLACRLRNTGAARAPARLFLSAAAPPELAPAPPPPLSDAALVRQITRLGGTAPAVLDDPALRKAFLPTLRADFELLGRCAADPAPLDAPFTLLAGADDRSLVAADLDAWRQRTRGPVDQRLFPGGHFYLQQSRAGVLALINQRLADAV